MSPMQEDNDPLHMSEQRTEEGTLVERVYIAVDVNNLWHSCRDIYGFDYRVNYRTLLDKIVRNAHPKLPRQANAVAYTITAPRRHVDHTGSVREEPSSNNRFLESLTKFGYTVKTRHMRYEKSLDKAFHTDWDVGIAVDVLGTLNTFDTLVLVSGDGDYIPLIEALYNVHKRVEVYTFEKTTSQQLFSSVEDVIFLNDTDCYRQETKSNKSVKR